MFGDWTTISIDRNITAISFFEIFRIIADGKDKLIGNTGLVYQSQRHGICHFSNDQPGFFIVIRTWQNLSRADAVILRTICLDVCNGTRFPSPSVVNEQFSIDAKELI